MLAKVENEFDKWLNELESGINNFETEENLSISMHENEHELQKESKLSENEERQAEKIGKINNFSLLTRLLNARIEYEEENDKLEDLLDFIKKTREQIASDMKETNFFFWFQKTRNILLGIKGDKLIDLSLEKRNLISKILERVTQDEKMLKFGNFEELKTYNLKEINSKKFDEINLDTKSLKTQDIENLEQEEEEEVNSRMVRNKFRELEKFHFEIWESERSKFTHKLKKNKKFFQDDDTFKTLKMLFLDVEIGDKMQEYFEKIKSKEDFLEALGAISKLDINIKEDFYQKEIQFFLQKIHISKKLDSTFFQSLEESSQSILKSKIPDSVIFLKLVDDFNLYIVKKTKNNLLGLISDTFVSLYGYFKDLKNVYSSSKRNYVFYDTINKNEIEDSDISEYRLKKVDVQDTYKKFVENYQKIFSEEKIIVGKFEKVGFITNFEKEGEVPKTILFRKKKESLSPVLENFQNILVFLKQMLELSSMKYSKPAVDKLETRVEKSLDKIFKIIQTQIKSATEAKNDFFTNKLMNLVFHFDRILQEYKELGLKCERHDKIIRDYSVNFSQKKFDSIVNSYLTQNWLNYHTFSRTKKPNNKFKVIESQILIKTLIEIILKEHELYSCKINRGEKYKNFSYWNSKFFFTVTTTLLENLIDLFQTVNPSFKKQIPFSDDIYLIYKYIMRRIDKLDVEKLDFGRFEKFRILLEYLEFYAEMMNPFNGKILQKLDELGFSLRMEKSYVKRYPDIIKAHYKLNKKVKRMIKRAKRSRNKPNLSQTETSGFANMRDFNRSFGDMSISSGGNFSGGEERLERLKKSKSRFEKIKADNFMSQITERYLDNINNPSENFQENFEEKMLSIDNIPSSMEEIYDFLVNLTPGKKMNRCKYRSLDRINIVKKVDIYLQRIELVENAEDLKENQQEIKKKLCEVAKNIGFD